MKTASSILLTCLLGSLFFSHTNAQTVPETKYLAFQIFTYGPNPKNPTMGEGPHPQPAKLPEKAALRDYIEDIKGRIGAVGDGRTKLAVVLGHLSFDHEDAEVTKFIELGFELALETDVAVGFHIDDSMFWASRKDLVNDPNNVEALDWDGTPCTGRRLDWSKTPSAAPPQMCFNSKAIQREVQQRAVLIGKAIRAGMDRLQQLNKPELFAGVIAGSETMIGQDFKTGKYLGYRALLNRGFSREHPPQDLSLELEKVVQEFIELWATGLAEGGVPPERIYSHTAFLSRRGFNLGDDKGITYMKHDKATAYSQHNHYAPPSMAFGKNHRPGFSTYPQPGLFDDIYELLAKHNQVGWASCEGTNMQPSSGPGQTGMNMETYLAKMFNHGATLTTVFSWGIGGEAMKNMGFRVVTEGEDALRAYRKFLKGEPLIEAKETASLMERLPPKIHRIQAELPPWIQKTGNKDAAALMQKLQEQMKAKNWEEVEKTADSILKLMGVSEQSGAQDGKHAEPPADATNAVRQRIAEKVAALITAKIERVKQGAQQWADSGRDPSPIGKALEEKFRPLWDAEKILEAEAELDRLLDQLQPEGKGTGSMAEKFKPLMEAGKYVEAEAELDRLLGQFKPDGKSAESPTATPASTKAPATSETPKYLIFWNLPEKAGELAERIGMKGDGKTRLLGFGLPISTYEYEKQLPVLVRRAFSAAREHNMAVMLSFDFHVAWKNRPDLWNWFDAEKPGYDPNNRFNVEWHGWDGPPNKTSYLNWGVLERRPPQMCFTSKKMRAEVTRIVSQVIRPVLSEEIAKLKADGKEILFAGVLVGSEPIIDDYSKSSPERTKMMKEDGVPAGPLGYRALLDRGFSAAHPPDDFRSALATITQETISFWCQQFVDAGIPAEKLYPHVVAPAPFEMTNARIWTAFNEHSRPGWTTYSVSALRENFKPVYEELEKHGNPAWAGVEANAGVPGSVVDWETYLAWHYNHGCVLMGVSMDGTGKDTHTRMRESAYGKEAIAAYHKFLTGQPLVEKAVSLDDPMLRIQLKMKRVRDGIERWHRSGKDPSAVGRLMEGAQPLANGGKLDELEKLVDHALEMLGETEQAPDVYRQK